MLNREQIKRNCGTWEDTAISEENKVSYLDHVVRKGPGRHDT